jgi:IclR family transcriptional regulator, positive regulator for flagellar biogenesis
MKRGSVTDAAAAVAAPTRDEVSALARGLALLRAVADADQPLSNRELATSTGIPKPTVSRLSATLQAGGFLRQAADSDRFSLGAAVLQLGNAYLRTFDFRNHARLHLSELAEAAGANVHLAVRDGTDVVIIDALRPRTALITSRMDVGSRMEIATSAAGRAYLAALGLAERRPLLDELRAASGAQWNAVKERLDATAAEYVERGYCSSFGEWHPEINALGVALHGPRGETYAVSVGGPAYKLTRELLLEKIAPLLVQTRRAIERELGVG